MGPQKWKQLHLNNEVLSSLTTLTREGKDLIENGEAVLRVFERVRVIGKDESGQVEGLVFSGEDDATRLRQITSHLFDLVVDARTQLGQENLDVGWIHNRRHDTGRSRRGTWRNGEPGSLVND